MPTMGHKQFFGGGILGSTISPTLVQSQGRISLLSQEGPNGTQYRVLIDYGEVTEEKLFPTESRKAKDGSNHHTTDSQEAFAQFDALASMYGGVPVDANGIDPNKSGSHEELDSILLTLAELPEDIVIELQRRGMSNSGRPKKTLDLQYATGIVTRMLGPRSDALRIARIHYSSYAKEDRLSALRDLRDRVAAKYLTGELLSSMLMSDRVKRDAWMQTIRQGTIPDMKLSDYLETQPTVPIIPLKAFRVRFVDQNGNEISGLPYEVSVRGVLNFKESVEKTQGGAQPGNFSSGTMLTEQGMSDIQSTDTTNGALVEDWSGRSLSPNFQYHLLYPYRVRSRGGTPRGTVKISITTPRNTNSTADWGNDRLQVYQDVSNASEKRGSSTVAAAPKMLLYSHNYKLEDGGEPERTTLTVPVYIEPLPMHLIESPAGSGNIVSIWSIADDTGAIPNHQKSTVSFTVLRPKASNLWEEADEILPDTRSGYRDKFLQYEEFTSPKGRAAYRDSEREASPVKGIKFVLLPDSNNTWQSAKQPVFMQPDSFGVMTGEVVPGRYKLKMLVSINADGSTGLRMVTSSRDPEYALATRYDGLDSELQAAVIAKYPSYDMKRWTRFVPDTIELGTLESPAGFYYRKTTEDDTTPVGIAGVKLLKSGSIQDAGSSRFQKFELKTRIPALMPGKEPDVGSVYEILGVQFPAIDDGWPGETTDSNEKIFDTATILLAPDSSIDLSMLSSYEQRYEAERDQGSNATPRLQVPPVGTRIAYMGYWIEHAWFDSAVGPELKNKEMAMSGKVHEYNMGRLDVPFYEEGVIRVICYYPQNGVMRRKIITKGEQTLDPRIELAKLTTYPRYNQTQASMDRVIHFEVESGPEGAILSGRWCPLEIVGMGNLDDLNKGITESVFEAMLEEIRRGGGPLRNFTGTNDAMPKWNQFWSTTADGWMFGGNDPLPSESDAAQYSQPGSITVGGKKVQQVSSAVVTVGGQAAGSPLVSLTGTTVNFEGGQGALEDIIHAPQPSYDDDHEEDFGFIGGE